MEALLILVDKIRCQMRAASPPVNRRRTRMTHLISWFGAYGLTILAALAFFLYIRHYGERLNAPIVAAPATPQSILEPKSNVLMHVLLALVVITLTCRALGSVFRYLHQPAVIGEVLAGLVLGPSLLGRISPDLAGYLLPPDVAPILGLVAQLGVILYMFIVGLELDIGPLWRRGHAVVAISHASIIVPFLLGATMALVVYPRLATRDVPFTVFASFLGVAMSVTAFPVLARILTDRGMNRSPLGALALSCAACDDVTAWCLLAVVIGIAQAKLGDTFAVLLGAAGYLMTMLLAARPLRRWLSQFDQQGEPSATPISVLVTALLLSAWMTEAIGIHAIFGAFVLGALIPHDSAVAGQFVRKTQDIVSVLLLPAFFAFTGIRTQIGLLSGLQEWLLCGLIIVVATAGKFGGSLVAARLVGTGWREAAALGILMNTRGLMELIVLNIGLELGVISPKLFAMLVVMAVATTIATTPILQHLVPAIPDPCARGKAERGNHRGFNWATRQRSPVIAAYDARESRDDF